ncbi:hypothetical protein Acsp02_21660 [Actinoplanes sp. NBRC 103695]|nr:hypothetical protein Acsp02_21660 [Actinoplanes sp. NBRC 103695]
MTDAYLPAAATVSGLLRRPEVDEAWDRPSARCSACCCASLSAGTAPPRCSAPSPAPSAPPRSRRSDAPVYGRTNGMKTSSTIDSITSSGTGLSVIISSCR